MLDAVDRNPPTSYSNLVIMTSWSHDLGNKTSVAPRLFSITELYPSQHYVRFHMGKRVPSLQVESLRSHSSKFLDSMSYLQAEVIEMLSDYTTQSKKNSKHLFGESPNRSLENSEDRNSEEAESLSKRRDPEEVPVSIFRPSNNPAFGAIRAMEVDTLGSLRYRIVYLKGRKELSPWHGVPLYHKDKVVTCICTTTRGSWLHLEISELEPLNPLRPVRISGKPATFAYNCPTTLGVLPQTRIYPEIEKGTDIISSLKFHSQASLSSIDGPMYVLDVSASTRNPGEIYTVKPVGAFHLLEGSTSTWVILGVDTSDPSAEDVDDIEDIERVWPKRLGRLQKWLSTCLNVDDFGHQWQDPLSLCQPRGQKSAMAAISSAHSSWQTFMQKCNPPITSDSGKVGVSIASVESSWKMYLSQEEDIRVPICAPKVNMKAQGESFQKENAGKRSPEKKKCGGKSVKSALRLWKCGSDEFSHLVPGEVEGFLKNENHDQPMPSRVNHRRFSSEGSEIDVFDTPANAGDILKRPNQLKETDQSSELASDSSLSLISTIENEFQSLSLTSEESAASESVADEAEDTDDIPVAMPVMDESLLASTSQLPASTPVPHKIVSMSFMDEIEKWKQSKIFNRTLSDKFNEKKSRKRVSFSETVEVFLFEGEKR